MKRLFILAAFAAVAFGLKAEVSTTTYAIVPAVNATAVTAGTATTNTLDVSHYTGTGEIIAPYSTANTSCVFSVTLEGTNTTDGGWSVISTNNATGYLSGVVRIPFMAAGLPPTIRVSIGATATNANGCAVFAARKEWKMGLREDFRNALGSIADAMPDATHRLRHGENEQGPVVQSRSRDFAETVSETEPAEVTRVIANAENFPTLDDGEAVELDGSLRVVTSLKTDPVGATFTVGLSAEFEKTPAAYRGCRRENGSRRDFNHALDVLTLENGTADNFSDALAPTYATAYVVAIRKEDWPEKTNPEPSDTIEIAKDGYAVALKVSTATRHDGWFILKCRTRG